MKLYLAGPMRGYPLFNFPAFDEAASRLRSELHEVVSPAEMDLDMGLDPSIANTDAEAEFDVADALRRDFEVILRVDAVVLLSGWEQSTGARAERFVAETTGKQVFRYWPRDYNSSLVLAPEWDGDPRVPAEPVYGGDDVIRARARAEVLANLHTGGAYAKVKLTEPIPAGDHPVVSLPQWLTFPPFDPELARLLAEEDEIDRRAGLFVPCSVCGLAPDGHGWNDHGYRPLVPTQEQARIMEEILSADDNPKDAIGIRKPQLHLVPESFIIRVAQAMTDGSHKYGPFNWREKQVRASVYQSAAKRHLGQWFDGEENAEDSGVPHLAHAAACIAILIDAIETGNLVDDRPPVGAASRLIKELTES